MENEKNNQVYSIPYIIKIFLNYWLLIGISLTFFLGIGLVYYKFASRTYQVYAKIAIETDNMNVKTANQYMNVNDMMNLEKNFESELSFMRSSPLIKEVIEDMNLHTAYYMKEDKIPQELPFSFYNIYKSSPFIVIPDENHQQPLGVMFYIHINSDEEFTLYAFSDEARMFTINGDLLSDYITYFNISGTYKFGDIIQNEDCSFKVLLNSNYNADYFLGKDLYFKFNSPQLLAYAFQESLNIKSSYYKSTIAELTFEWENLAIAKDFLNNLITKYTEKNLEKKNYNATNTLDYINRQLASISGSLGQSEQQLQRFRTNQDVMNIEQKSSDIYSQQRTLETNRDGLQSQLQYLSRLRDYFNANKDMDNFITPSFMGMSDATLATLIQELTTLSTEKQNLISTNQLKNPRIKTLDANISTIKGVITENINFNIDATQNELNDLESKLRDINKEINLLPQTERQLTGLEREFNLNDAVYTSLLDKKIQAQIIMASNKPDCEIIEPVRYAAVSSPSIKKAIIIALFLGLFLPSIYIIYVNFLSPKIRTKEELSRIAKYEIIDRIPRHSKNNANVIKSFPNTPIAERFHSIRSSVVYYLMGETNKCILVTSSLPNEGKSFIAMNLAHSFAKTHFKTALVSFDLRKKDKVIDGIEINETHGISSYLIGHSKFDEIVTKTETENLDFISSGPVPPDPIALISSKNANDFFNLLKSKYEYIIIDTPPYALVTDPFLLMNKSDMNLYITRMGTVMRKPFKQSMEDMEQKGIKNTYIIQNDVTKVDNSYYQNYSYSDSRGNIFKRIRRKKKA